jgi:hypothetical protein
MGRRDRSTDHVGAVQWPHRHVCSMFSFEFSSFTNTDFTFLPDKSIQMSAESTLDRSFKRRRALSDVDGSSVGAKKKRRLRRHLITSRLSRPYSAPATNIVGRGTSGSASRIMKREEGKYTLRRAAIMNCLRKRITRARDDEQIQHEVSRPPVPLHYLEMMHGPWNRFQPLPPSPLGLSNYDALDMEDDWKPEHERENSSSPCHGIELMSLPVTGVSEYDYLDDLDGVPHEEPGPIAPSEEIVAEMLMEEDMSNDIQFVRLGMG